MSHTVIEVPDLINGYVDVVRWVRDAGVSVAPRGVGTREIEDAVIRVDNPWCTLPTGVGRGIVPGIGAVEALQLLAGISTPKLVVAVGPQFRNYAEDNGMFHGAYGLRTRGQYHHVVQKLTDDPSSRQAVVTLWNPEYDNLPGKRDYPCTIMHQFRIRDGALNMSVYMRSNDVWLGLAYDGFQFTRVQIALAHVLGVEVGTYTHHVGSLHLYDSNLTAVDKLAKGAYPTDYYKQPAIVGSTWDDVEWNASSALHAAKRQHVFDRLQNDSERWFASSIRDAVAKNGGSASLMTVE